MKISRRQALTGIAGLVCGGVSATTPDLCCAQTPADQIAIGMVSRDIAKHFGSQGILLDHLGKANIYMGLSRLNEHHVRDSSMRYLSRGEDDYSKSRTFIANYVLKDVSRERMRWNHIIGIDKGIVRRNDSVIIGMYLTPNANNGAEGWLKIFNPRGKESFSKVLDFSAPGKNQWRWRNFDPGAFYDSNGPGTYAAAFYYDGKFWEARSFEVVE